jgi:hypothetical protein
MINALEPAEFFELVHEVANSNAALYQYNAISCAASVNFRFHSLIFSLEFHKIVGYVSKI